MKKIILGMLVLVALAVVPAIAQGRVMLKRSGNQLANGAAIYLNSTNVILKDGSIGIECTSSHLNGTLSQNPEPWVKLTSFSSSCVGAGYKEDYLLSQPATLSFGEEGSSGVARIPNGQLTLNFRDSKTGALVEECKYSGNLNMSYEFGSNLTPYLVGTTLTRVSGASLCEKTVTLTGSFAVGLGPNGEQPITASSEAPKEVGLFRNSGGTRSPVLIGEELQTTSTSSTIKLGKSSIVCEKEVLKGTSTHPGAQPAQATITSASFTGNSGSNNDCVWEGLTGRVTANASSGWSLGFEDSAGNEAKGSLTGSIRVTAEMLVYGFPVRTCTYEATSSMGTAYNFKQALGLKFNTTALTLAAASNSECPSSGEINLGESTVTVPGAGNLPVEVVAG